MPRPREDLKGKISNGAVRRGALPFKGGGVVERKSF